MLSIDLQKIIGLGWKALVMFFATTVGVVLGGPLAVGCSICLTRNGWQMI
ncbi:hypothetical protein HMPREF9080_01044 [Cardiobacterium valvarum F0432]|uniref:Uncharacterized protein n=1 Tax=Cardiobacterium valvarum F0432 TaxID=797473 RepID=G9ZE60_9GAMM|nr:hypothetical protein [Cardiobacterium valvarum]EHM54933.1 hypothetical protein HMPREF9080_01044 [Cardiobacterium valvarum F0432]